MGKTIRNNQPEKNNGFSKASAALKTRIPSRSKTILFDINSLLTDEMDLDKSIAEDTEDQYDNFVMYSNNPELNNSIKELMSSEVFFSEMVKVVNDLGSTSPIDSLSIMINALDNCHLKMESTVVANSLFNMYSSQLTEYLSSHAFNNLFPRNIKTHLNENLSRVINYYAARRVKDELGDAINLSPVEAHLNHEDINSVYNKFVEVLGSYFVKMSLAIKGSSKLLSEFETSKNEVTDIKGMPISAKDAKTYHEGLDINYKVISKVYELMNKYTN